MKRLDINDDLRAFAEAEAARLGLSDAGAYIEELLAEARSRAGTGNLQPERDDGFYTGRSLEELAAQQGVPPIAELSDLKGDFWPESETADDFVAQLADWRRDPPTTQTR